MVETRIIHHDELRKLCIDKNWYTCGNNESYSAILEYASDCENVSSKDIVHIAEDIKRHSDTEYPVGAICFEIAEICHSFFEEPFPSDEC